jgi:hypothetical protein
MLENLKKDYIGKLKLIWKKVLEIVGNFIINKYEKYNKHYPIYAIFSSS